MSRAFRATYRLQLTPDFGFAAAAAHIPYLRDLGISHLYLSPSLQARPGSTHGYDVIDPTRLSDDLGGEAAFRALAAAAHDAGLGIVLDLVPNHMATDEGNRYWTDPELRARFFDIDPATGRHRRFFDIDDLAGVRVEDPGVFEETHRVALGLVGEGLVDALRIDHPDGLADPLQYFERLRDGGAATVWIEKILESGESLRPGWPVAGTVGYEFLNDVCGVFVDAGAEDRFTSLWETLSGDSRSFPEVALEAKLGQATGAFAPEIERLLSVAAVPGGAEALAAGVASFPVYRSYVVPSRGEVSAEDREVIGEASLPAEVARWLTLEPADGDPPDPEFVTRFQQTTPPVVAKGIEDTAFYRYGRLLSLNDVGGDPGRFGIDVARFHAANAERAARFPRAMLTTMTHDTKRSADVRARITALTWLADEWASLVGEWMDVTAPLRSAAGAPDDLERYFLLQTLAGAWPIERERVQGYMEKALREAKRNTNWVDQNSAWESGVSAFVAALYEHEPFLRTFEPFAARVAQLGDRIALGALALKLTSPGMPDLYQGDELPLRALVDPDNRRPVDWDWQEAMMRRLQGGSPPDADTRKLWLCVQLLGLRIRRAGAFGVDGGYAPVEVDGGSVVAFTRVGSGSGSESGSGWSGSASERSDSGSGSDSDSGSGSGSDSGSAEVLVVVAVRREVAGTLPALGGSWRDVLGGETVSLDAPVAVDGLLTHGLAVLERV